MMLRAGGNCGQIRLEVYNRVVFFDWFGTLSCSTLWQHITNNPRHPLHHQLTPQVAALFSQGAEDILKLWMRGTLDYTDILSRLKVNLPANYRIDYLERVLLESCRRAEIRPRMFEVIKDARQHAFVAVATDNMDCFSASLPRAVETNFPFDDVLISAEIGSLKKEDPYGFFGPALDRFQLGFGDALLVDDCPETCSVFRRCGGTAVQYRSSAQVEAAISRFLCISGD